MSCCGKKRNNPSNTAVKPGAGSVPSRSQASSTGFALQWPVFEYLGGGVLSVTGQGSGMQYRFVGNGARARVNPLDRHSLALLSQLRQVARL